jgi:hypothetical protein
MLIALLMLVVLGIIVTIVHSHNTMSCWGYTEWNPDCLGCSMFLLGILGFVVWGIMLLGKWYYLR